MGCFGLQVPPNVGGDVWINGLFWFAGCPLMLGGCVD